jgi:hypothetical protein
MPNTDLLDSFAKKYQKRDSRDFFEENLLNIEVYSLTITQSIKSPRTSCMQFDVKTQLLTAKKKINRGTTQKHVCQRQAQELINQAEATNGNNGDNNSPFD